MLLLGTTLAILDSSIFSILIVPIMEQFKTDLNTVEWVITSYNIAFAVFMIGFGSLGDAAGRRRMYIYGKMVFVIGSGLAATTQEPWQLIAFRAIQGVGAAALAPNALALILDYFPKGRRGVALGIWGAAAALGGALGPIAGVLIAETWGWRAVFLVNIPVGLLVVGGAYAFLNADNRWNQGRFDTSGFLTLSGAVLAVSALLMGTPSVGGTWIRSGFGAAALLLGAYFVMLERHAKEPLVDLEVILRRDVVAANLVVFVALLIMSGGMFLSVLYAQLLTDATPTTVALLLAPCAAMTFVLAPVGGWLGDEIGPRVLAVAGLLALTASVAVPVRWHPATASSVVFWTNLIAGVGIGLSTPALIRVSTESVAQEHAGLAAGVYKTVNELGGVFWSHGFGNIPSRACCCECAATTPGSFSSGRAIL
jgi:EmrB/QacA subfamily drug resistance transporter